MQCLRRWSFAVVSRVDALASRIENHEALVVSGIRDLQAGTAKAKVQLRRVRRDGEALRRRIVDEHAAAEQWTDRAQRLADEDEPKALECLRRKRRAAATASELERRWDEHERLEKKLSADIRVLEARLAELREQRNLMRTRETRADALRTAQVAGSGTALDLGEVFERWEMRVTEAEMVSGCDPYRVDDSLDDLELVLAEGEELESLQIELGELRAAGKEASS